MKRRLAMAALIVAPLWAQYGQYPPGGQYPQGGQYPPGGQYPRGQSGPGGGLPFPHKSKKGKNVPKKDAVPNFNVDGHVISSSADKLEIGTDDGRDIKFTVDPATTKFSKEGAGAATLTFSDAAENSFVHVEAFEDDEWFLTAATVELRKDPGQKPAAAAAPPPADAKSAKPSEAAAANTAAPVSTPEDLGPPPDAPGRPHLHHGKPLPQEKPDEDEDMNKPPRKPAAVSAKSATPDAPESKDGSIDFTIGDEKTEAKRKPSGYNDLIGRTREWSMAFSEGLPNFVCEQVTTRYIETSRSEGFQPQDLVSAKVVYEDGKEHYQEITVGGKRTNKNMMELGGSTSTGEFASTLRSLFSGYVDADFKFRESSTTGKTAIAIYDLTVLLHHSDWTIQMGSQQLRPAYSGSVWVDKATSEVRRIEIQAENVPKNFPGDSIAMTVDYEPVRLGSSSTFLLPVHSENLTCFRGTTICSKNTIDFRNYHKYSGESSIEFK